MDVSQLPLNQIEATASNCAKFMLRHRPPPFCFKRIGRRLGTRLAETTSGFGLSFPAISRDSTISGRDGRDPTIDKRGEALLGDEGRDQMINVRNVVTRDLPDEAV